jgi:hypothetical protein
MSHATDINGLVLLGNPLCVAVIVSCLLALQSKFVILAGRGS